MFFQAGDKDRNSEIRILPLLEVAPLKQKILVVDDERPIAEILKYNLERKDTRSFSPMTVKKRCAWLKKRIPI